MIQWLKNYGGIKPEEEKNERIELETIRRQVKEYKLKYENYDNEMEVVSSESEELSPEEQAKIDEELKKSKVKRNSTD